MQYRQRQDLEIRDYAIIPPNELKEKWDLKKNVQNFSKMTLNDVNGKKI